MTRADESPVDRGGPTLRPAVAVTAPESDDATGELLVELQSDQPRARRVEDRGDAARLQMTPEPWRTETDDGRVVGSDGLEDPGDGEFRVTSGQWTDGSGLGTVYEVPIDRGSAVRGNRSAVTKVDHVEGATVIRTRTEERGAPSNEGLLSRLEAMLSREEPADDPTRSAVVLAADEPGVDSGLDRLDGKPVGSVAVVAPEDAVPNDVSVRLDADGPAAAPTLRIHELRAGGTVRLQPTIVDGGIEFRSETEFDRRPGRGLRPASRNHSR